MQERLSPLLQERLQEQLCPLQHVRTYGIILNVACQIDNSSVSISHAVTWVNTMQVPTVHIYQNLPLPLLNACTCTIWFQLSDMQLLDSDHDIFMIPKLFFYQLNL